jgi:transposase
MATLIAKIKNGTRYYYLANSARVNGQPRIVRQVYLGTAESVAEAVQAKKTGALETPTFGRVIEFGAVAALLDIAERLGVREIIDRHAGKRAQGISVGTSMLLAAINRSVGPVSKAAFCDRWFDKTVLAKFFPEANKKNLSSQGFWNNMHLLEQDQISKIETDIVKNVVKEYNISTECLLFDNTNFFTYINSTSESKLAKRGKSKEHRNDLKLVGLSLMVSNDFNMPLFHEVYPGNTNDSTRFAEIIDLLKQRYLKIANNHKNITLVFDRGNNSASNIENLIIKAPCSFHFVGGLKQCQYGNLLDIADGNYEPLNGENFKNMSSFRTTKEEYNQKVTVIVTNNPVLYDTQMIDIMKNVIKCKLELQNLSDKLDQRNKGLIRGGRPYTKETLDAKICSILSYEHMKSIFKYEIIELGKQLKFEYDIDNINFDIIKRKILGKKVLFTDRHEWSNEQIVGAYHSQFHVEECFKQMKNTKHLTFRPIRHFTDNHIRIHAFYCVLALILSISLKIEFERMGHNITINKALELLSDINQIISVFTGKGRQKGITYTFSEMAGLAKEYIEKFNLQKYAFC